MAKKVKFPLKMADGTQVRDLEELRSHFDLASVLSYYDNGKLAEWLVDRYYEEEAEKISALDVAADNFKKNLCEILGVKYNDNESDGIDMNAVAARNERLERLRSVTADDKILAAVDRVAFTQEDLDDLICSDFDAIYLFGSIFRVSPKKSNVKYIGINNPLVDIRNNYSDCSIEFNNVDLSLVVMRDRLIKILENKLLNDRAIDKHQSMPRHTRYDAPAVEKPAQISEEKTDKQCFEMPIDDVFMVTGRGTVATGTIASGVVKMNDKIYLVDTNGNKKETVVTGIELSRKLLDFAEKGANVGILLRGIKRNEIKSGYRLTSQP